MSDLIRQQIKEVCATGATNMFDIPQVQIIANELYLAELVIYLEDKNNRGEYANFILTGE